MKQHEFKALYEAGDERREFYVPASMLILTRTQISNIAPSQAYFVTPDILAPNSITHVYLSLTSKNKEAQIKNVGAFSFANLKKEESWPSIESLDATATISAAFLKTAKCCKVAPYVVLESPEDSPRKNFERDDADIILLHEWKDKPTLTNFSKYFFNPKNSSISSLEGLKPQILMGDAYEQEYTKKGFNRFALGWVNKTGLIEAWTAESVGSVLQLINNPITKNSCPQKKSNWSHDQTQQEAQKIYKNILPALLNKEVIEL